MVNTLSNANKNSGKGIHKKVGEVKLADDLFERARIKNMKCYAAALSGCNEKVKYLVEKKADLSHRKAYYCEECVQPYRDSDEGEKHFRVTPITNNCTTNKV